MIKPFKLSGLVFLLLFTVFFIAAPASAETEEEVAIDNRHIQQYKGYLGFWSETEPASKLSKTLEKAGSTKEETERLNGHPIGTDKYVFIPYSKEMLKELKKQGIVRKTIKSKDTEFIWPVDSPDCISSPFGFRNKQLHTGADIPIITGSPVVAAMSGTVVSSGYYGGHGKTILLKHGNSFYTRYSHNSALMVKEGDMVKKGQLIALSGNTGQSTGPHIHFEVRFNSVPLNPLDFLPHSDGIPILKHRAAKPQKKGR